MVAASRCKAVSIINYLCFSLSLSLSRFLLFTPLHTETDLTLHTWLCTNAHTASDARRFQGGTGETSAQLPFVSDRNKHVKMPPSVISRLFFSLE